MNSGNIFAALMNHSVDEGPVPSTTIMAMKVWQRMQTSMSAKGGHAAMSALLSMMLSAHYSLSRIL